MSTRNICFYGELEKIIPLAFIVHIHFRKRLFVISMGDLSMQASVCLLVCILTLTLASTLEYTLATTLNEVYKLQNFTVNFASLIVLAH